MRVRKGNSYRVLNRVDGFLIGRTTTMKITRQKRSIFIEAPDQWSFEEQLNECLKDKTDAQVQIYGLFKGAILYTEMIVEDDEMTIADLFEKAGCGALCGDCPNYNKPTDGRVKYTVCNNRKISEGSRACDDYYLGRRENAKAG